MITPEQSIASQEVTQGILDNAYFQGTPGITTERPGGAVLTSREAFDNAEDADATLSHLRLGQFCSVNALYHAVTIQMIEQQLKQASQEAIPSHADPFDNYYDLTCKFDIGVIRGSLGGSCCLK